MDEEVPRLQPAPACEQTTAEESTETLSGCSLSFLALRVLAVSFVLGILADLLLRATPWGVNALLWIICLAAGIGWLFRSQRRRLAAAEIALVGAALLFAAGFMWRDAVVLRALDVLLVTAVLAVLASRSRADARPLAQNSLLDFVESATDCAANSALGAHRIFIEDVRWKDLPRGAWSAYARPVAIGVLIALPLLGVFNGLFMSADKAYEDAVKNLLAFDLETPVYHALVILIAAWGTAGFLRMLVPRLRRLKFEIGLPAKRPRLGVIELAIPLALLDLLFLAFVLIQLPYLFGGHGLVQNPNGPTYAEYARRGFFELLTVAVLSLALLLSADALSGDTGVRGKNVFRFLAGCMVVLVLIVMASALHRMSLYRNAYGLTIQRFYATAFMLWLGILMMWFAASVLGGRRQQFAFGVLVTGLIASFLLHVVNPDACIARTNLARATQGKELDIKYLTGLSADAVPVVAPALLAADPRLSRGDVTGLLARMALRLKVSESAGWRTWIWSRDRARQTLDAIEASLDPAVRERLDEEINRREHVLQD